MKAKREREEACSICGHYHDYEGGEPCGICGHVMLPAGQGGHESCMPATIISGFLYVGSYDTASRQDLLKSLGITHILNTVPTCPALYKNTFTYHTVEHAPPDFQDCFKFLDSVQEQGAKVLVYCMSGISRSPAVVIGYLMKLRGWRLAEAYKWVKDKRPQVKISQADTERLQALEVQLRGSCSCPSGFAFLSLPGFGSPSQQQQQQHAQSAAALQQQQQQPQQATQACFGVAQPPPWAAAPAAPHHHAGGAPLGAGGGAFVFGAAHHPAAPNGHTHQAAAEVGGSEMES